MSIITDFFNNTILNKDHHRPVSERQAYKELLKREKKEGIVVRNGVVTFPDPPDRVGGGPL